MGNHIFISYSRSDGEFAQKLAEDLRANGVNIWLDKIDIPVGARWDRAVEEALETCGRLLLIMSPTSVSSENVMDEIGEAFQNKKQIIPIMHQKCDVPMRIRRLQYIDFTGDYDTAFRRLIDVVTGPTPSPKPTPKPIPVIRRYLYVGIGAAVVILAALFIYQFSGEGPEDGSASQSNAVATEASLQVEAVLDCVDAENLKAPSDASVAATIKFVNHRTDTATIYNVNSAGEWLKQGDIAPSQENTFNTFAGHIWEVADSRDNCVGIYKMGPDQNLVEVK